MNRRLVTAIPFHILACIFLLAGCYGLPEKKAIDNRDVRHSQFSPPEGMVSLVVIRPYNFYYFGHPIEVTVNDEKIGTLPNQTYTVARHSPGKMQVVAQSGTMGPSTRRIELSAEKNETVYLLWHVQAYGGNAFGPDVIVEWRKINQEEAVRLLRNIEKI